MENKRQKTIYLDENEEVDSIVAKIAQSKEKEIALAVPKKSILLQNLTSLKTLNVKAKELKKDIFIIKSDDSASSVNVDKIKNDSLPREEKKEFLKKENIKVFDIARKATNRSAKKIDVESFISPVDTGQEFESDFRKKLRQEEKERKNFLRDEKKIALSKKAIKKMVLLPSISSKFFAGFILVCAVIAATAAAFALPEANINITLKPEVATNNFEFIADDSLEKIDSQQNKIPLQKIEVENEETESYPTTGKKRLTGKASGKITVFNEYSSNPQMIVANTRFLSKEGYLFRIKEAVTIPGFSRIEGKDVPGEINVTVDADKPGEQYNIGSTSFTLPGLQGSAKYSNIYAKSAGQMTGGADKEVSYFSEGDYLTAKDNLVKKARGKNEQDLSGKISEQDILLKDTKQENDVKVTQNMKIGDAADTFQMTVSAKTSVLFIKQGDLDKLIDEKINSKLDQNKELARESKKYEVKDITKSEKGEIIIPLYVSYSFTSKVDIEKIKREIAGKSEAELKEYFSSRKEFKSTNVNLWPFWVKNIPSSPEKIKIAIDISEPIQ